jgi:hypothetical protein
MTTGKVPMVTAFEQVDPVLFAREGSEWKAGKVMEDQTLIKSGHCNRISLELPAIPRKDIHKESQNKRAR